MLRGLEHWRGRAGRLTLAVVVHLLGFFLAFYLSPPIPVKKAEEYKNFQLLSLFDKQAQPKPTRRSAARPRAETTPKPPATPLDAEPSPLNMMFVSSDVFRTGDISRIKSAEAQTTPGNTDAASADRSAGAGPGGAKLYNAEWYREPTQAEMDYYMPKGLRQTSWGEIACRAAPDFRVEDCQELAEGPAGSGIARSMRQAAWQYRVRPPRMNGKPMIGAWIRIRYDLTVGFTK